MYVCMHACVHVCMYVCMHACVHACMHALCMLVRTYVCMYVCLYVYIVHYFKTCAVDFCKRLSGGGPSQPEKVDGVEHPMWGVSSASPLGAGRRSLTGSGG